MSLKHTSWSWMNLSTHNSASTVIMDVILCATLYAHWVNSTSNLPMMKSEMPLSKGNLRMNAT